MSVRIWLGLLLIFAVPIAWLCLPGWKPLGWLDLASFPMCALGCWLFMEGTRRGSLRAHNRRIAALKEIRAEMIEREQGKNADAAERGKGDGE